jgi:hypothetical protein
MARKMTKRDDDDSGKSVPGTGRRMICAEIYPIVMTSQQERVSLRRQIERGKKALEEAAMNAEVLAELIQGLQRTWQGISKKRK